MSNVLMFINAIIATIIVYSNISAIEFVVNFVSKKKKIGNKRIKIRVVFTIAYNDRITTHQQVFSNTDLKDCMCDILKHVAKFKCKIKSMELLTTED